LTCKSNDQSIAELANLVDVFYIGGTKNGALLGEALVICRSDLKEDFRYLMKQRAAMPAKGFVLGMQFEALLKDGLYLELAAHANTMAEALAEVFEESGFPFYAPPCTNQIFPVVPDAMAPDLIENFGCMDQTKVDGGRTCVRFVTSWATMPESVEAVKSYLLNH
jgi:threonine aldolase